ncbi:hypothetical protein ABFA25_05520 [Mycobacterium lepromatosis]|uniref:hypothetical protein n=1 Tax=Mycobacterium lepromatosis TaxID=480418 RepID=UPI000679147F|nr:hypothetical protein [Mycobacterium lepromatosis]
MDVVLGVAVAGRVARLALVGSGDVLDQSIVDLADNPIEKLTETVVGTNQLLAPCEPPAGGHAAVLD